MTRKIICFLPFFTFSSWVFGLAERDFRSKNGQVIRGTITERLEDGSIILKRSKDLQLFRVNMDIFTEDDQAFVKNNFPPNHDALPEFQRPLSKQALMTNAKYIDSIIESKLRSYNQRPNKLASDETFLRRTYLKIIGRIPTYGETKAFLTDRDRSSKRTRLIDSLLLTEGYVSHWFHFWADILRAKDNLGNRMSGAPFVDYIREFIAMNRPYDEWVKEMLSSSGPYWEEGNGGVGYFLRDAGMQLDNMSNTVRIFLGTSLECAQCHDHPFDRWTQKQFFEMAAYTYGAHKSVNKSATEFREFSSMARKWMNEEQKKVSNDPNLSDDEKARQRAALGAKYRGATGIGDIVGLGMDNLGQGKINLPKDYQYDNAQPGQELQAKTIFGLVIELDENLQQKGSRASYASWLASPDNPRFTTVIANRMWKAVFGLGLIEPVDNMFDDTLATHPELMLHLEKIMVALDYDLKEFLRILYNTKAFQREAPSRDIEPRDPKDEIMPFEVKYVISGPDSDNPKRGAVPYFYQGPVVERLSGEQLWDSLVALNYPDIDKRINSRFPGGGFDQYQRYISMTAEELFLERLGIPAPGSGMDMQDAMANKSKPINENCPIRPGRLADPSITAKNEKGETVAFCCNGCKDQFVENMPAMDEMMMDGEMMAASTNSSSQSYTRTGTKTGDSNSLRASEVGHPAPAGHFIRQFGGSPRDQIQVSHKQASVDQVLAVMNGYVEKNIISNPKSHFMKKLASQSTIVDKIDFAFKAILQRKATSREKNDFTETLKIIGTNDIHKDIAWILLNSHEFLFVR